MRYNQLLVLLKNNLNMYYFQSCYQGLSLRGQGQGQGQDIFSQGQCQGDSFLKAIIKAY